MCCTPGIHSIVIGHIPCVRYFAGDMELKEPLHRSVSISSCMCASSIGIHARHVIATSVGTQTGESSTVFTPDT